MHEMQALQEQQEAENAPNQQGSKDNRSNRRNDEFYRQVENAMPGIMFPIRSSWVKSYGYDTEGTNGGSLYLQYHGAGHDIFQYPYLDDPAQAAASIEMSGSPGGWVHDELGVPTRTPYKKISTLPDQMGWFGGQAQVEAESEDLRAEKVKMFGTKRPAYAPNPSGYQAQTKARTESTRGGSGELAGTGAGDPAGIIKAIRALVGQAQAPQVFGPPTSQQPAVSTMPQAPMQLGTQGTGAVGRPITARTTGGELPARARLDFRRTSRGPKGKGMGGNVTADWGQSNWTQASAYNSAILVDRVNASVADLSESDWQALSKTATGSGLSQTTIQKVRSMLQKFEGIVNRTNYRAVGNSMSFKDHPYYYRGNDGTIVEEYPCAKDWKTNVVGKTMKLKVNTKNTQEHGDVIVGTITYGWDEENNCPKDILVYDRENVMKLLEDKNGEVHARLAAGLDPDVSTEYQCRIKNHQGRRWQVGFVPGDTCFVDAGNCPSGTCDFAPAE
jgi:hypothetical protein